MDRESLESLLALGLSREQIGRRFGRHPSTVDYWIRKHGLRAVHRERHLARGGIPKERLEELIARGLPVRGIAAELGFSQASVRHWLKRHGLRTHAMERRRQAREARLAGRAKILRSCRRHGITEFWLEGSGYYRCLRCRWERVARRRRRVKAALVEEAGGRCKLCGYDRCAGVLSFHHVDPASKSFSIGEAGATISIARLREEARKCVLLCANCHGEVELGVAAVVAPGPGD